MRLAPHDPAREGGHRHERLDPERGRPQKPLGEGRAEDDARRTLAPKALSLPPAATAASPGTNIQTSRWQWHHSDVDR